MILRNGVEVSLIYVSYWENAPNLISVSTLDDKGVNIKFTKQKLSHQMKQNKFVRLKELLMMFLFLKSKKRLNFLC